MRPITQLLYGVTRLALFALTLAFLSFWALNTGKADIVEPVTKYATRYIPMLLLPVSAAMVVVLLARWGAKNRGESVGFGDFFAFFIAVGLQVATIVVYHAQGNDIGKTFGFSVPEVAELTNLAEPYGILGVAGLQGGAFLFYWFADPDPKTEDDD